MADTKRLTAMYVAVGLKVMKWGTLSWTERTYPARVIEIKESIIEKLGWHTSAMPKFYKASLSEQEMSNLDEGIEPPIDPTTILRYSQWVNEVWPDGFPVGTVAFIVSVEFDVPSLHRSGDADPNFERTVKTEEVQFHQKTPNAIYNGRPHDRVGPPIHLYHPVFDSFLAGLNTTKDVPAVKLSGTIRLLRLSQAQYNIENGRTAALVTEIEKLLGASLSVREADGVKADGSISAINGAVCLIMEIKNEIGQGGSDPSVQGAISYAKYWAHDKMADIRAVSCCPSFILAVAGPWVCILGAIMLDHPIVQPLTPFLWVGSSCNPRTQSDDHALARVFTSLASSVSSLVRFYDNLPDGKNAERFDPHIRHYNTNDNRTDFTYLDPISDGKLVFLASTKSKRHIIVKYAESYHIHAHRLLAKAGLAPELLFVSSEHGFRVGKLLMLVMEKVPGSDLVGLASVPRCVEENVSKALKLLHEQDIVFGDLRRPNVMATLDADGTITGGMLVDFDWCGRDGQATYPTDINTEIDWPMGVGPGTKMSKEHDWVMFNKMFPS